LSVDRFDRLGVGLPEDEPLEGVVLVVFAVDVVLTWPPPLAALAIAAPPPASRPSTETVATPSRSRSRVIPYLLSPRGHRPSECGGAA
jgi:hypothetical protein